MKLGFSKQNKGISHLTSLRDSEKPKWVKCYKKRQDSFRSIPTISFPLRERIIKCHVLVISWLYRVYGGSFALLPFHSYTALCDCILRQGFKGNQILPGQDSQVTGTLTVWCNMSNLDLSALHMQWVAESGWATVWNFKVLAITGLQEESNWKGLCWFLPVLDQTLSI